MAVDSGMTRRLVIAFFSVVAVSVYAIVGVLQIMVWNPLAAVRGRSLPEIRSLVAAAGESMSDPAVIGFGLIGILLSITVSTAAVRGRARPSTIAARNLVVLVGGAPAYFWASFGPGMSMADAFGISGGDYAPWGAYLYATSAVALLAFTLLALIERSRPAQTPIRVGIT